MHFLMKKNASLRSGTAHLRTPTRRWVDLNDGGTIITFDNAIIATGSSTWLVPGTSLSKLPRGTLSVPRAAEDCCRSCAIGMEFRAEESTARRDHRGLPWALPNEDADVSTEIEKRSMLRLRSHRHEGRVHASDGGSRS